MSISNINGHRSNGYESSSSPEPYSRGAIPEPIAVVGMALRLPGGVSSPEGLWRMLCEGRSGQCELPGSRFNLDGFYHPKGFDRAGSIGMSGGYFIDEDVRAFDNDFFGINNLEATYMDPQQRKLLEVVFECFENAGGNFTLDFQVMQMKNVDELHTYSATGMGTTILANRISHVFNMLGPSLVLDTACSSTLYCLHVASAALANGECDAAVVAGSNLIQSPEQHIGTMKAGVLSPTSTCHTFDASADGYGRAEGIGALYLKRLSDAVRDGDPVRSIIRATAANHNGRTQGITLPSPSAQIALMRKTYEKCGLSPNETAYVECHGTGTSVGDPIEVEAIARFMMRPTTHPILIGGVKPNFGHSEAASGITGVIKATLMLEKGFIPPTIGVSKIKIKCGEWGVKIVTEGQAWPVSSENYPRRVGVNAFGYGGANAHAILEGVPPDISLKPRSSPLRDYFLLPFSAANKISLNARVEDLVNYDLESVALEDLAFTLGAHRSHLTERGFFIVKRKSMRDDISLARLCALDGHTSRSPNDLAFIFTGQGAQWVGMGRELFKEFTIFRDSITEMDSFLSLLPHPPSWALSDIILGTNTINNTMKPGHSQAACTAIQIGLIQLLYSWSLTPSAVLGHSSGEIAAAYAAGVISAKEAITIAYYRGYVVENYGKDSGAMMAVNLSREAAEAYISSNQKLGRVNVACINSPENVTISGDFCDIDSMREDLQSKGIFARKLRTSGVAYHSHQMLHLGQEYERLLEAVLRPGADEVAPRCLWISSVTGDKLMALDTGPAYWRMNLERPVEFSKAVSLLAESGKYHTLELGPHSVLEMPFYQTLDSLGISRSDMPYCPTIVRNMDSAETVLSALGNMFLRGRNISFELINGVSSSRKGTSCRSPQLLVDLPRYRWARPDPVLWSEPRESVEFRNRVHRRHELLGSLIPGGDKVESRWKNILRLEEVTWIEDHKLDGAIVFPAAAFVAMAIEALKQCSSTQGSAVIHLEDFDIIAALPISADSSTKLELLTTLKPSRITHYTSSKSSWEVGIISVVDHVSTIHVRGTIGLAAKNSIVTVDPKVSQEALTPTAPRVWYDAMSREGLNFGPRFRTVTSFDVDRGRVMHYSHCRAPFLQDTPNENYPIHPVTIDAALQASIVAVTAGSPEVLKAMVPTRISSAFFLIGHQRGGESLHISSSTRTVGFGASMAVSEMRSETGCVVGQLNDVRLVSYQTKSDLEAGEQRHPMLRVLWKPDIEIGLQDFSNTSHYLEGISSQLTTEFNDDCLRSFAGCIDLLGHKNPHLRVLECGASGQDTIQPILDLLGGAGPFPRLWSYQTGRIDENGVLRTRDVNIKTGEFASEVLETKDANYDLVLFTHCDTTSQLLDNLSFAKSLTSPQGVILAALDAPLQIHPQEHQLVTLYTAPLTETRYQAVLAHTATSYDLDSLQKRSEVYIICSRLSPLVETISCEIQSIFGTEPVVIEFRNVRERVIPPGAVVVSLLELEKPLLVTLSDDSIGIVKQITDRASTLLWVTRGGLLEGTSPDYSLAWGLARAVALEQPALRFITFDVDNSIDKIVQTARNIVHVLARSIDSGSDSEFMQRNGVVHISRFVPDDGLNASFRQKQGAETVQLALGEVKPVQLAIGRNNNIDSIYFKQIPNSPDVGLGCVEVEVEAVSVNAKDYYALGGKVDTRDASCTLEYGGIIRRIGDGVRDLQAGDRVVVMAPGHFRSHEVVPSWACQKLQPEEDILTMCTLPVAYSTAIYALLTRANLQPGESVLIHSGTGGVGIAAIQVALQAQAEIFTTVSMEEKKEYLVRNFNIKRENIFNSRDVSFADEIMKATEGQGVDVVLNSLTGELLHASWRCCSHFGRFIEIGKRDMTEGGRLEMKQFLKSVSFAAFDLSDLYYSKKPAHNRLWASLLARVLQLYRQKQLVEFPLQTFDISQTSNALRTFGLASRIGKIVISMRNPESKINVQPLRFKTQLSPAKTYLMIGCLGGLGRCISRWMMDRGARSFVFLGRSGILKDSARDLVRDLEAKGARCIVIRGDVSSMADVNAMVQSAEYPIGGVIQAAMGLHETLFTSMSATQWHEAVRPKVQGTWNVHNALMGKDSQLDFFLMMSSNCGSVGTATESNYCAGNYFLDIFARYRRSLGLPAVALGLGMVSEVGYLHDNPEIGELLIRRGVHPLPESELLTTIDVSLSYQPPIAAQGYDRLAEVHILTGLESVSLVKRRKRGFEDDDSTLNDIRSSLLLRALHSHRPGKAGQEGDLPEEVCSLLDARFSLADALRIHITRRFGNMILTPYEKVDVNRPLAAYGMDSMVGAELRSWLYRSFKVDIPFLDLLGGSITLEILANRVAGELKSKR
ncbi:reducing type I polyketide synthase 10 [Camillea tinctor]|nr:reducing type I polyketide synthase 10 [Camillea tinctor]